MPLAVGIPTYNQAPYLSRTLNSLLSQTVSPSEIVVSDNHSTDDTQAVLRGYGNRVTVISPPTHQTLFEHFNFVATHLHDEWIALIGSDDVAKPVFVERLLSGARRATDAVLVRGAYETIDGTGALLATQHILSARRVERFPTNLLKQLGGPRANLSASAIRRSAWESAGRFPPAFHLHGDWAFYLRLSRLGAFVYAPFVVTQYRVAYRPGLSESRLLSQIQDDACIALEIVPEMLRKLDARSLMLHRARIERTLQRRFGQQLAHASSMLPANDRANACVALTEWARALGREKDLERFSGGELLPGPSQRLSPLKRSVRALYDYSSSTLRGRG